MMSMGVHKSVLQKVSYILNLLLKETHSDCAVKHGAHGVPRAETYSFLSDEV